ncbi:MAG: PilZ domain-containing protein [Alteraurantiacibacter sp.]
MVSMAQEKAALRVKCRTRRGMSADLEVLDISIGGAMVEARGWSVQEGERVLMTFPGLSAQPSELVWIEDGRAGLVFEQPLHETVFDKFAAMIARR